MVLPNVIAWKNYLYFIVNCVPANAKGTFTFKITEFEVVEGAGVAWETGSALSASIEIKEAVLEKEATPAAKFTATGMDTGKLTGLVDGGSYQLTGASPASFTASGTSQALTGVSARKLSLVNAFKRKIKIKSFNASSFKSKVNNKSSII